MQKTLISICIPAYKRVDQLSRLLISIQNQTFKEYEVIITDDSPDDSVKSLCDLYLDKFPLHYFKNNPALGTPENWNEGIRKANGQWIKLMHDDDWFLTNEALGKFASAIQGREAKLIFSGYRNIKSDELHGEAVALSSFRRYLLKSNPVSILSKNCIGPPSVTLFERMPLMEFDKNLKWLVDMEFYIRQLKEKEIVYINEPLIGIGISPSQVTAASSMNPSVEIPEHLYLLKKLGERALNNIPFYDAFWRLFRNFGIYDIPSLTEFASGNPLPDKVISLIKFQRAIPYRILRVGLFSKFFMLCSYIRSRLVR